MDLNELFKYGSSSIANILYTDNNITMRNANDANAFRTHVIVVGCGGTGGRLIPVLAQHIKNHNYTYETTFNNNLFLKHKMKLVLIDNDIVEEKNLKRQHFYSFDVGKGKAETMAERYSTLYGMDIKYHNDIFHVNLLIDSNASNLIIFDCTDNKIARQSIEKSLDLKSKRVVLISCGNGDEFGQVLVSQSHDDYWNSSHRQDKLIEEFGKIQKVIADEDPKSTLAIKNIPSLLELNRDFKDDPKPSCTDMVLIDDQSMPINSLVAQLAYNAFYMLVAGKNLTYHMVKCNINNTFSTSKISHPKDMLNLLVRGVYGECNADAINALAAIASVSGYSANPELVIEVFNNHDRRYTEPFYKKLVQNNWRITNTELEQLNWRL